MASQPPSPTKYPSAAEIASFFKNLEEAEYEKGFARFSPDVDCVVTGSHPCSGHFTTLSAFKEHTMGHVSRIWKGLAKINIRNVVGGGEQEQACIELTAQAECKNGRPFLNKEVMMVRFDERGMIVQMGVYIDAALTGKALEENES
ncbi:hypothetical protein EG328_002776 [Venturia inaequalis]|uniref:SnoaL-like domain-containing protein n=1 Tax=Venturia inaequalis TaxID=5025 RepID=A0A8H3ZCB6_VENIN|nr:hypothetical protein EG328_002776 [Venturia inaequalis]KAE9994330.1 hypothetical protein EG327_011432 [Venturia inaequalis]RDI86735.1 hypothetical protein Vi05172_g3232 [Venturia inaequalis]